MTGVRKIVIEEDLRVCFPGRGSAFDDGVEIGMLAALMAARRPDLTRTIAAANLDMARLLAGKLGYRVTEARRSAPDAVTVTLSSRPQRPKLRLVSSR